MVEAAESNAIPLSIRAGGEESNFGTAASGVFVSEVDASPVGSDEVRVRPCRLRVQELNTEKFGAVFAFGNRIFQTGNRVFQTGKVSRPPEKHFSKLEKSAAHRKSTFPNWRSQPPTGKAHFQTGEVSRPPEKYFSKLEKLAAHRKRRFPNPPPYFPNRKMPRQNWKIGRWSAGSA